MVSGLSIGFVEGVYPLHLFKGLLREFVQRFVQRFVDGVCSKVC